MQRVFVLFFGILSVVRATPFDLDSVDRPTPFWVENDEFGNDAFSEDSEHQHDYNFGSFESSENSNHIDEADEGKSMKGLSDLFGDLKQCNVINFENPGEEGCIYATNGQIVLDRVLLKVNIEDAYAAFEEAGIEKCEVREDGSKNVPKGGCFFIKEGKKTIVLIGVYDGEVIYKEEKIVEGIKNLIPVEKCDLSAKYIQNCAMFDETGIHYLHVFYNLTHDEIDTFLGELDLPKCIYDIDLGLTTKEPCYLIIDYYWLKLVHFLNLHGRFKRTQDDDDDDQHYSEETYGIADPEVQRSPSLVQTSTRNEKLHQLKLGEKGIFSQRSLDDKKTKDVPLKKTESIQLLENVLSG